MKKILALQMDPLHTLNYARDSSLALGFEGQRRGYEVFYYTPKNLTYRDNTLLAEGQFITLKEGGRNLEKISPMHALNLEEAKIILIRQDPPFDLRYITNTYLLEILEERGSCILNSPRGIRNACEKTLPLLFPDLIPPTLISENHAEIYDFAAQHKDIILKPLYGYGGHDVLPLHNVKEPELLTMVDLFLHKYAAPLIVQPLLKEVYTDEKRIHLLNGRPVSVFKRIPKKGEVRANMAQGGTAEACELSVRDLEICDAMGPLLQEMGLYFVGIDVIGDYLIEINVTSPTGIRAAHNLYDIDIPHLFFEGIEEEIV